MPPRRSPASNVDWSAARQRLAKALAGAEEALHPSHERTQRILDERAKLLARPAEQTAAAGAALRALTFALGGELYGIETRFVREVVRLPKLTLVPDVPDFVLGVISFRGEILPLFDLQRLFGRPSPGAEDRARAIVCGKAQAEFAIVADSVHEVESLFVDDLVRDPALFAETERGWIRGVTRSAMTILDGAALLQDRRLFIDR